MNSNRVRRRKIDALLARAEESARFLNRQTKPMEIFLAWNFAGAESDQMGGHILNIKQFKILLTQLLHQSRQCHFRSIGLEMEHRLTEKCSTDGHPI